MVTSAQFHFVVLIVIFCICYLFKNYALVYNLSGRLAAFFHPRKTSFEECFRHRADLKGYVVAQK